MVRTLVAVAKSLGNEIQRVRQLKGLSLQRVAQPAGVSATYLQKLERDEVESPSPHRLHSLARVLGVEYRDLFELAGYPVPGEPEERPSTGATEATVDGRPAPASALRRMFMSDEEVTDTEVEELVRYLSFIREQRTT
jgi:transcriptional regulator with XRE-family HTH domain